MTSRERLQCVMNFKSPDKPFIYTFGIRPATMEAWLKQGHPEDVNTPELLGYDWFDTIPLITAHCPRFEKVVVEEKDGHITYYDEEGALRIDAVADQGTGFTTRSWLKFPVESREDFIKMKERYVAADMARRLEGYDKAVRNSLTSERPVMRGLQGFYWTLRQWMGFEGLSVAFYDMPDLIDEMMDFILDFNIDLIRNHLEGARVDLFYLNEDMAYKTAAMVSPKLFKEKFVPRYKILVAEVKRACADKMFVDCDGHISELIPLWIEGGIDGALPVEIAAEQDIVDLAARYPRFLLLGGIDKRVLARGRDDVKAEVVPKAKKLYARGGWIPAVDHGVPPDAKFDNFKYMIELLKS